MIDTNTLPWIPLGNGESFKPLRFYPNDRGRALLLRVEPGRYALAAATPVRRRRTPEDHETL